EVVEGGAAAAAAARRRGCGAGARRVPRRVRRDRLRRTPGPAHRAGCDRAAHVPPGRRGVRAGNGPVVRARGGLRGGRRGARPVGRRGDGPDLLTLPPGGGDARCRYPRTRCVQPGRGDATAQSRILDSGWTMMRSSRSRVAAVVAAALLAAAPPLGAQVEEEPTTSTTPPEPTTTSTTPTTAAPGTSSTTSTTTTTLYVPPVPPGLEGDPRLPYLVDPGPGDALEAPEDQPPFDPGTVKVLPERVEAARAALEAATEALAEVQRRIERSSAEVARLSSQVEALDGEVRRAVRAAARARRALRDHAVRAYMVGPVEDQLALLNSSDAVDLGVARSYLEAVAETRERLVRDYERAREGLRSDHGRLAARLGEAESELAEHLEDLTDAFVAVGKAADELAAYEAGAHAYIDGFVFPVAGEADFIDSWGYPRMTRSEERRVGKEDIVMWWS